MLQHTQLSEVTQQIISKLQKDFAPIGHFPIGLIASLYAQRPEADPQLVQALSEHIIDLSEHLEASQIATLQADFSSLIFVEWNCPTKRLIDQYIELTPELCDLCAYLAKAEQGDSLYFPYAANGSFLLSLGFNEGISGFEPNKDLWAICQIRLKMLGHTAKVHLGMPDLKGKRFDRIFLPLKLPHGRKDQELFAQELTNLFSQHLCDGGRMVCLVPPSIAFNNSPHWKGLRQNIATSGLSATLINLPKGLMAPYTSIGLCALLLQKDQQEQITLVDASDSCLVTKHRKGYKLHLEELKALLCSMESNKVWSGTSATLNASFSFWAGDYLPICHQSMLQAGEQFYPLNSLVEVLISNAHTSPRYSPRMLRFSDLKDSFLSCDIEAKALPKEERPVRKLITQDCLLLAYLNGKMKVGRLIGVSPEYPVSLGENIHPVRLTQPSVITEDYLLRSFVSELSLQQANVRAKGTLRLLSQAELLNLQIIVPDSLTKQGKLCHDDAIRAMQQAGLDTALFLDEFRRDMHLKKHAIGQTLFNLNNWWLSLKRARELGANDDSKPLAPNSRYTIGDAFTQLDIIITKLSSQLSKFDTGYGLVKKELELFPFLLHYIQEHHSPLYEIDFIGEESSYRHAYTIHFPEEALRRVLDNILSNAATHGFGRQASRANRVRIELSLNGTDCIVSVSNNGRPLSEGFDTQDVFRYGRSTGESHLHYGIGGYEISRLMQEFGAEIKFDSIPHSDYPVEYKLIFRNTKL